MHTLRGSCLPFRNHHTIRYLNQPSPLAMSTQISPVRDERQFALTKSVVISSSDFEPEKPNFKTKSTNKSLKKVIDSRISFKDFETKRMKNFNAVLKQAKGKPKKRYGKTDLHTSIDATKKHKHSRSFLPQIPNISIV